MTHDVLDSTAKAMQSTSVPYLPASFWSDLRTEFLKVDVVELYRPILEKNISQEDLQSAIDFYRSPAGKHLLSIQSAVTAETKVLMRAKGEEIGKRVYEKHKDEIDAAKKQYELKQKTAPEIQIPQ